MRQEFFARVALCALLQAHALMPLIRAPHARRRQALHAAEEVEGSVVFSSTRSEALYWHLGRIRADVAREAISAPVEEPTQAVEVVLARPLGVTVQEVRGAVVVQACRAGGHAEAAGLQWQAA